MLIDAFLVRMTLVPATMSLLGRSAWWLPRWLDRLLPTIDFEGESAGEEHAPSSHVPPQSAAPPAAR